MNIHFHHNFTAFPVFALLKGHLRVITHSAYHRFVTNVQQIAGIWRIVGQCAENGIVTNWFRNSRRFMLCVDTSK